MKVDLKYDEIVNSVKEDAKKKKLLREQLKLTKGNIERVSIIGKLTKINGKLEIWTKLFPKITHDLQCSVFINKNRKCEDCGVEFRWAYYSDDNISEFFEKPNTMKQFEESDFLVSFDGGTEFDLADDEVELGNFDEVNLCVDCIEYLRSQRRDTLLFKINKKKEKRKVV